MDVPIEHMKVKIVNITIAYIYNISFKKAFANVVPKNSENWPHSGAVQ